MLLALSASVDAQAETTFRVATFAAPLSRDGPGLLLRDILGENAGISTARQIIQQVSPDILLLTDFDYDANSAALRSFADSFKPPFPYHYASAPNAGWQRGDDLDGDGFSGDAHDAVGYGRFFGDGGLAILSRFPIDRSEIRDLSQYLWKDMPGANLPRLNGDLFPTAAIFETFPVSSTAHWMVPIDINGSDVTLLAFDATPPVFDGPEDFNGLRNCAEIELWNSVLDGELTQAPERPIVLGNANLDPHDGDGQKHCISALLGHPALQDPRPSSAGAAFHSDPDHIGPPLLDTVDWPEGRPGNLRVSYVLPSAAMTVVDAGVFGPRPQILRRLYSAAIWAGRTALFGLIW